jgi:hypothetical protein
MLKSRQFSEELEETLKLWPERNRRWDVSLFRSQRAEGGGTENVLIEHFRNVRSKRVSGDVVDYQGVLQFIAEDGKEVMVSSMPFIAKEVAEAVKEQE